ncbi:non-hydrolyzing UDP-N-acetylglucosamine 2-epimerase [Amycolatopsis sp. EV170708-02-1]|uniref:non-hydrolyzing UDP-N-acetylglucosamine 2-epimerase n=1 Tax=Amycolatopsis sp. EV170708-02-1 TaxID=2919322 RepID=UPI001F0BEF77|nr:UDP-N-acetylglucosamine 2-epimerase (non-hydrolyzing) [Amycolatopsis sp. EV170708-02-1]UMP06817.1 UDP-N-acetylglucosamine 2-epimerase (non-hydrolyzing) [Amycolatopsis sp. EV170708-02-1]
MVLLGGTRPEAVKLAPIARAMRVQDRMQPVLVASGQHETMFSQALSSFGLRPDVRLHIDRPTGSLSELLSELVKAVDVHLEQLRPAAVVVQGDTTTALAGALAAFWRHIPVVHVEAGLRSHDPRAPFPEEANRKLVAQLSTLHLAPTARAVNNLLEEGIAGPEVLLTGNTVVDAVLSIARTPVAYHDHRLPSLENRAATGKSRLLLATMHRRESLGAPLAGILAGLRAIVEEHADVEVVLPVHPNPEVRDQVVDGLLGVERVHITGPLHYAEFCRLLSFARLVLTDSGGVQEEAPSFGVPCVVLREITERMEAVEAGVSVLAGPDPLLIARHASRLLAENPVESSSARLNPFGDGQAAVRAEQAIARLLGLTSSGPAAVPQAQLAKGK